ncbi:MAG TPA: sugar phosphate isomerase/epimerase family protein [Candidatus Limnocylindrales bacterium]|nr:sugar phosphate isomerase/epimerase family protein [Candidatus Limnocylindrales bacterium]
MATFALHTWSLDTTALADVLRVARDTGWDAVELRRIDFIRGAEAGQSEDGVLDVVKKSGLRVACVGAQSGWMFTEGDARRTKLGDVTDACRRAAALGCPMVMSPADTTIGPLPQAAASLREAGDIAARHGVRLAIEAGSQSKQFNTLAAVRELLRAAAHPACGLLVDSYHLERCGEKLPGLDGLRADEVLYVQFSDVPRAVESGKVLDRLPAGQGVVPFREFFAAIDRIGYRGPASYEAPNPAAWSRPPADVAREALDAARRLVKP